MDLASGRDSPSLNGSAVEVHEEPSLAVSPMLLLIGPFAPEIGPHVLQRAGVPGVGSHLVLGVIVAEGNVGPLFQMQLRPVKHRPTIIGCASIEGILPLDFRM